MVALQNTILQIYAHILYDMLHEFTISGDFDALNSVLLRKRFSEPEKIHAWPNEKKTIMA